MPTATTALGPGAAFCGALAVAGLAMGFSAIFCGIFDWIVAATGATDFVGDFGAGVELLTASALLPLAMSLTFGFGVGFAAGLIGLTLGLAAGFATLLLATGFECFLTALEAAAFALGLAAALALGFLAAADLAETVFFALVGFTDGFFVGIAGSVFLID
jgi:hypothetical protein